MSERNKPSAGSVELWWKDCGSRCSHDSGDSTVTAVSAVNAVSTVSTNRALGRTISHNHFQGVF